MADSVDFVTAAECTGTAYADCLWQGGGMDGGFLCDNGFVGTVCCAKSGQGKAKAEKEALMEESKKRYEDKVSDLKPKKPAGKNKKRSWLCGQCGTDSML